jgi:hypothetical protein
MADFILDTIGGAVKPFVKKVNRQVERDNLRAAIESFLGGLESAGNPALARIDGYTINDGNPPNTAALRSTGVHIVEISVRTLSTLDFIVIQASIGENASLVTELSTSEVT